MNNLLCIYVMYYFSQRQQILNRCQKQYLFSIYFDFIDLYFDLREMIDFTLDVAWEDIVFARAHAHDFKRIAVVTDSQWVGWSAWLSQIFVRAEMRVFDDEIEARSWLDAEEGVA